MRRLLIQSGLIVVCCLAAGCATVDMGTLAQAGIHPVQSTADFDRRVLQTGAPTAAFFYSPSCPHCHAIMRKLPTIARDYRARVQFLSIDVTRQGTLRQRYKIGGVPVIALIAHGEIRDQVTGNLPWTSHTIRRALDRLITPYE